MKVNFKCMRCHKINEDSESGKVHLNQTNMIIDLTCIHCKKEQKYTIYNSMVEFK